ncbi:MAG: hypothetical protein ACREBS_02030 [Nitrososphaerales archaeon]
MKYIGLLISSLLADIGILLIGLDLRSIPLGFGSCPGVTTGSSPFPPNITLMLYRCYIGATIALTDFITAGLLALTVVIGIVAILKNRKNNSLGKQEKDPRITEKLPKLTSRNFAKTGRGRENFQLSKA